MTWGSERSGRASREMVFVDQMPTTTRVAVMVRVMNLFVAQRRMSFSIKAESRKQKAEMLSGYLLLHLLTSDTKIAISSSFSFLMLSSFADATRCVPSTISSQ